MRIKLQVLKSTLLGTLFLLATISSMAQTTYVKTHPDISAAYGTQSKLLGAYSIPVIPKTTQQLRVNKRVLKATLNMGEIYKIGNGANRQWSVNLKIKFRVMKYNGTKAKDFPMDITISNQVPEKSFVIDYTSLEGTLASDKIKQVNIIIENYSNVKSYSQSDLLLTLVNTDDIDYGINTNHFSRIGLNTVNINSSSLLSAEIIPGAEQSRVKFKWSNPGLIFSSYDLEVLKVEPDFQGKIVTDWSKASRAELDDFANEYTMTLSEGTGFYFWRVRPIGSYFSGGRANPLNLGSWTQRYGSMGALYTITDDKPVPVNSGKVINTSVTPIGGECFYYQQFDEDKNWIYNKVLTEGARQSETVTYANGLNQVIQQQSKLFSSNQVIGKETVYDFNGRPALNSLPAPVNSNQLGYKPDFFKNQSGIPYSAADFDEDGKIYSPTSLSNANPGSPNNYYSDGNILGTKKELVPDAEGYPFTRTLFYNDATGRVFKQGGAGKTMKLTDEPEPSTSDPVSRNLQTFYGGVAQMELDRVFGNEAPIDSTVYKTISVDPNKISSVTYTSKAGQILATCLSNGSNSQNLSTLNSQAAAFNVEDKLPPAMITEGNNVAISTKTLVIENPTDVTLDYSITPQQLCPTCEVVCHTCDYEVTISVSCPQDPLNPAKNSSITYKNDPVTQTWTPAIVPVTVSLIPGTYLIEKKVKVGNTDVTGGSYLKKYEDALRSQRDSWTGASNCCGSFTPDVSNFSCAPASCTSTSDLYNSFLSGLYTFVKQEQEATVGVASYKSKLTELPSGILLSNALQVGGANVYVSAVTGYSDGFKNLIDDMMAAPYSLSCTQIEAAFNAYGRNLEANVQRFGSSDPNVKPDKKYDLLKYVFQDLKYSPDDNVGCAQYRTVIMLGQPGANEQGNIRLYYRGLDGLASAPNPIEGVKDVEVIKPTLTEADGENYILSTSTMAAVLKNTTCVNSYQYPNALTSGLGYTVAEEKAYLAQKVCECLGSTTNQQPPSTTIPTLPDVVSICKSNCDDKRLSFLQSVDNFVNETNAVNGLTSSTQTGWQTFEDLKPLEDKQCMVDAMVAQCKVQCEMPQTTLFKNQITNNTYTNSADITALYTDAFKATIRKEQHEFEQAMTWNPEFAPVGNYTAAGEYTVIKEKALDFITSSLERSLNSKNSSGLLSAASSTLAPITFQSNLSSNANYSNFEYTQGLSEEFLLKSLSDPTKSFPVKAVTNIIWDKVAGNMIEMNVAIYTCGTLSSTSVTDIKWAYVPPADCGFFNAFVNTPVIALSQIVNLYYDKYGAFHAVMQPEICPSSVSPTCEEVSTAGTTISTGICEKDILGTFVFDLTSDYVDHSILLEAGVAGDMVGLTRKPVKWNSDAATTACDLVTAINNSLVGIPYKASWKNISGTPRMSVSIPFSVGYPLTDANSAKAVHLNVTRTSSSNVINEVTISANGNGISMETQLQQAGESCAATTALTASCPYGYKEVTSNTAQFVSPPSAVEYNGQTIDNLFTNDLKTFWLQNLDHALRQRVPTALGNIRFETGGYPLSQYNYYQSHYYFKWQDELYAAYLNVIWDKTSTSHIEVMEIGIYRPCQNPNYGSTNIFIRYMPLNRVAIDDINNLPPIDELFQIEYKNNSYIEVTITNLATYVAQINHNSQKGLVFQGATPNQGLLSSIGNLSQCSAPSPCHACLGWSKQKTNTELINETPRKELTCEDLKKEYIDNQTASYLDDCFKNKLEQLRADYKSSCLNKITDDLRISYPLGYHHYTLYYYDRAKNLVKTVPPAGVEFITSTADFTAINNYRNGSSTTALNPSHRLATTYEYNSIKQLISQNTPDGGTSKFWYNAAGQLILSQDADQADGAVKRYSYTKYDYLGRAIETGELTGLTPTYLDDESQVIDQLWKNSTFPDNIVGISKSQVIRTIYSMEDPSALVNGIGQSNLRNRVSKIYRDNNNDGTPESSTFYSYDPHGNVQWLIQEIPGIGRKTISYEYDLVSGKVNKVIYNIGTSEQFLHRYVYDSDNRITNVFTSTDGEQWDKEAGYDYYLHGPLARTEIGQDKIQGVDFTYTIEGYLKSINQSSLDVLKDPGKDGSINNLFAKDEFAMELGYYDGDFNRTGSFIGKRNNADPYAAGEMSATQNSLYNGNISYWMSNIRAGANSSQTPNPMGMKMNIYAYDQLNRIKKSDFRKYNNGWTESNAAYDEEFTYDGNGNIKKLKRNGYLASASTGGQSASIAMDDLTYKYNVDANDKLIDNNRLYLVKDAVNNSSYNDDLEDQGTLSLTNINSTNNYQYDKEGKLVKDVSEGVEITWNILNKVASVKKMDKSFNPAEPYLISFEYDAAGNRVVKRIEYVNASSTNGTDLRKINNATYYVRDASGNIMAIYSREFNGAFTTWKMDELPIYGSSRLGMYKPGITVQSVKGYANDLSVNNDVKSTLTESSKWLVPTATGVNLMDFNASGAATSNSAAVGSSASSASELDSDDNFIFGAFADASNNWKFVDKNLTQVSSALSVAANTGLNAHPVIIRKPGTSGRYYFVFAAGTAEFNELKYLEFDKATNGNISLISTAATAIPGGKSLGNNILDVTYADGSSRLFGYSKSTDNLKYELYCIDVEDQGFKTPKLLTTITKQNNFPISGKNELALSPDGKTMAMSLNDVTDPAFNQIIAWDFDIAGARLLNPKTFNVGVGKVKHVEFEHKSSFLFYTIENNSQNSLGRIDLVCGLVQPITASFSSLAVDVQRAPGYRLVVAEPGVGFKQVNNPSSDNFNNVTVTSLLAMNGLTAELPQQTYNSTETIANGEIVTSEQSNWVVGANSTNGLSGAPDVTFGTNDAITISNPADAIYSSYSAYKNMAVAEDEKGEVQFKFFTSREAVDVTGHGMTNIQLILNKDGRALAGNYFKIIADPATQSIVAKAPGDNKIYYLITGGNNKLYYHTVDMNQGANGKVTAINQEIKIGASVIESMAGHPCKLAVYNDLTSDISNRLYVAVQSANGIAQLFQFNVTDQDILSGALVKKWEQENKLGGIMSIYLGDLQISPSDHSASLVLTKQVRNLFSTNQSTATHSIERFAIASDNGDLTYSSSKTISSEQVYNNKPDRYANIPVSMDYSPKGKYNYIVCRGVPAYATVGSIFYVSYTTLHLKRVPVGSGTAEMIDGQILTEKIDATLRRAKNGIMYCSTNILNSILDHTGVGAILSYGSKQGDLDNSTASGILASKGKLSVANTNYGLQQQPFTIYNRNSFSADKSPICSMRTLGKKLYELTDHLGNVRITFSDQKKTVTSNQTYYNSDFETEEQNQDNTKAYRGAYSAKLITPVGSPLFPLSAFSKGYVIEVQPGDKISASVWNNYAADVPNESEGLLVVSLEDDQDHISLNGNVQYFADWADQSPRQPNTWNKLSVTYTVPYIPNHPGKMYIKAYCWNPTATNTWFDDHIVEVTKVNGEITTLADVNSWGDYYAFGSPMPGRNYSSDEYRFGFNGKESDSEVSGSSGVTYDYGARMYDARLGRWTAVDPLAYKYPAISPYAFVNNMPIIAVDPDGKEVRFVNMESLNAFDAAVENRYSSTIKDALTGLRGAYGKETKEYNKAVKAFNKALNQHLKTVSASDVANVRNEVMGLAEAITSDNVIHVEVISPTQKQYPKIGSDEKPTEAKLVPPMGTMYKTPADDKGESDKFPILESTDPRKEEVTTVSNDETKKALIIVTSPTTKLSGNSEGALLNTITQTDKELSNPPPK